MTPYLQIHMEVMKSISDPKIKQKNKQTKSILDGFKNDFKFLDQCGYYSDIRLACMQLAMLLQGVKIDTLPPNRHGSHEVQQEFVVSEAARIIFSFTGSRRIRRAT